jgi:hypothetical protein
VSGRIVSIAGAAGFVRLLATAAVALALLGGAGCRDSQVLTHSFADMAEARAAGAVERGWMPAILPPGAHDIRIAHDEATSRRWGLFSFGTGDDDVLKATLGSERTFAGLAADAPPRIEWWPIALRGTLDSGQLAATGLRAHTVAGNEGLVVAVNWNQRRAYYWTPR